MKIPFKSFRDQPRVAYIEDIFNSGNYFPLPIHVKNYITGEESALISEINRTKGKSSKVVSDLITAIAEKAAENNGGDPLKVGEVLVAIRDDEYHADIQKYKALCTMYCAEEFSQFVDMVEGKVPRIIMAARTHALLNRIPATSTESGTWNPLEWKTEDALNEDEFPAGFLYGFSVFFQTEQAGISTQYIREVEHEGTKIQVYKYITDEELKKIEDEKISEEEMIENRKTQKKRITETAGKS